MTARNLKSATLGTVTDATLKFLLGNRAVTAAGVAIGSTASAVATAAFTYSISGVIYAKGAVAAGTAFTDVTPQADGTTKLYLVTINAGGTIVIVNGETLPAGGKPDALRVPPCPVGSAPVGVVKVLTVGAAFVPGTTLLSAGTVTDTYYDLAMMVGTV